jgi:DNA-binding Xre family transcriptional regulator
MIMASKLYNKIPSILKERGLTISDLQRMTGMSYPATHNIATVEILTDETRVGTLRKVGEALNLEIGELITIEE